MYACAAAIHCGSRAGGYRYSDYDTTGTTNTYKFEVQYAPIQDARLRFSFDRAIRAPNLIELFVAPSYGQEAVVGTDPCAGLPTATLVQCQHTGVTPAQYACDRGQQHYPVRVRSVRSGDRGEHPAEA